MSDTFLDYLAENNIAAFIDEDGSEYIWKKHAALALNKNEKTLERKAQAGKIKQIDNDGKTYYLKTDLANFEIELRSAVHKAVIETDAPRQTQTDNKMQKSELNINGQFLQGFAAMFSQVIEKLDMQPRLSQPRLSQLAQMSGILFLDADGAAQFSGIGKTKIIKAIHAAEDAGTLQRYSGEHGKAVWRTDDLQTIIESMPPTVIVKRLPPAPPAKKGKGKSA